MEHSMDTTIENKKFKNKMIYQFIISFIYIISKIFDFSFNIIKINSIIFQNKNFNYIQNVHNNLTFSELLNKNNLFRSLIDNIKYKIFLNPTFFNKDNNDISFLIYFIQACSNMRAYN
jgi:hypothetical protein